MKNLRRNWKRTLSFAGVLVGIFWLLLPTTPVRAQDDKANVEAQKSRDISYLKEMPDVTRVLADFHGANDLETATMQYGALGHLQRMMSTMSGISAASFNGDIGPAVATPQEQAVWDSYKSAMNRIFKSTATGLGQADTHTIGENSPLMKWERAAGNYADSADLEKELFRLYFSAEWQARYRAIVDAKEQEEAKHRAEVQRETNRYQMAKAKDEDELAALAKSILPHVLPIGGYIVALIVAVIFAFRGRFGLDPNDPRKLRVGGTQYTLHSVTGTVVSPKKDREVHTHVGGGQYNTAVWSQTTTVTHLEFFLKQANGDEKPFQMTSSLAHTAMREGHKLTAVGAIQKGCSSGNCFLFRNHSTQQVVYDDWVLKPIVKHFGARTIPAFLLLACSGLGLAVHFDVSGGDLATIPIFGGIGLVIYYGIRSSAVATRLYKVKRQIGERLIPQLDSQP